MIFMKKILIYLFCLSFLATLTGRSLEASPVETFERANAAYYKNQLNVAQQLYKKLIGEGVSSGHLFYNLGNIYYRQAEFGEAIQYYEKALRFLPRNADVRANLKFIEKKRVDQLPQSFWMSFLKIFFFWYTYFTLKELVVAFTVIAGVFWFLAWLYLLMRRNSFRWGALVFCVISVIMGSSMIFKYDMEKIKSWGIVLKLEVDVRPTYLEQGKSLFKLHEGTRVEIIGHQEFGDADSWAQIRLPEGQKGWVKREDLGLI